VREADAAELGAHAGGQEPALDHGAVGVLVAGGRSDVALAVERRADLVALLVQGRDDVLGHRAGLVEHHVVGVLVELRVLGDALELLVDLHLLEQHEANVAEIDGVFGSAHGRTSAVWRFWQRPYLSRATE